MANSNGKSRSKNASGGEHAAKNDRLQKAATAPKGRHKQPKGSGEHNTAAKQAKPQGRKSVKEDMDMEF